MSLEPPAFDEILRARAILARYLSATPLYRYPLLEADLGLELLVKHENHQPTGAFKVRGGLNLLSKLADKLELSGVITASTGNHGQSIAYAARVFGIRAVVVVPRHANPEKVGSMEALGAEVRFHGSDFDDARTYVEEVAQSEGLRYIHSANEPDLIAGVATYALEIFEAEPEVDCILVPVGGGSGASGCCLAARSVRPQTEIIAVQSESAPAAYLSWKTGKLVESPMQTFAEGVATGTAFELPQRILREHLADFVLVSDNEIRAAIVRYLRTTRNLVEGAGATALAGAIKLRDRLRGKKTAVILSGGNLAFETLRSLLATVPCGAPSRETRR